MTARQLVRAIEHLQMRREQPVVTRARREPERLQHPQTFLGDRPRIDVDALVKRRREFLQHQRNRRDDRALGVNRPDIDAGRPLRLPRDVAKIGIARIEPAVDQPARAFVRQRQHREEAFALGCGDIELVAPGDRPERIRIMVGNRLERSVGGQARNVLSRRVHQRRDAGGVDGKNHRASGQLQHGHLVERTGRVPLRALFLAALRTKSRSSAVIESSPRLWNLVQHFCQE